MTDRPGKAAIVEKPRTERVAEALEAEGVYDPSRRIEAYDADRVALPVTRRPTEIDVEAVVALELSVRERGLADVLRSRGVPEHVVEAAPSSWAVIGNVVLVDFGDVSVEGTLDRDARETVGEALLEVHGDADTVLARGGISGTRRDPAGEVVAGSGDTETVHTEHGIEYALDLSETMFSPGNKAERARMGDVVSTGERVFDMFAGIGYFSLPMARAGASVTAAEIDPTSHRRLVENARRNGVTGNVHALLGDCRTVETTADRVVMGYYEAHEYLGTALDALVSGGIVHLHEATPDAMFPDRPLGRLRDAAAAAGRTVDVFDARRVKSHSAGVVHGVVDAHIE
ncbi:class I SAM-dependent methyltransferase family protein [Natronomonas sp. LN261]|uniref:class I SAM-dependent methyltransferase n=1 Tax=Natronomonas sp. LN261 TaxID=2750669 RepID=UPI0015EF8FDE|nr:class I SAM-dependent methyltransferase family protein [Natronomonas sp. LN261]